MIVESPDGGRDRASAARVVDDGVTTVHDHGVPTPRLPTLTSLRFFAAMLVVAVHLGVIWPIPALARGQLGVSFFYLLSGFILAWAPSTTDTVGRYYRRRFARIVPLHVLTWVLAVAVVGPLTGERSPVAGTVLSLLLLQSWIPTEPIAFAANTVSWSLSVEVLFYALFPLALLLLRRCSARELGIVLAVMAALVVVLPVAAPDAITAYVFPPARLPEFVIGIALALLLRSGWSPRLPFAPVAAIAALAVVLAMSPLVPYRLSIAAVTLVPFALLIVAAARSDLAGTSRLAGRPWVRLGEWSFALFMTHQLLIRAFAALVDDRAVEQALTPVLVAGCIAVAAVTFSLVERPLERRLRGPQGPVARPAPAARVG